MKNLFIAAMAVLAVVSLTGCESVGKGKGKAPVEANG